MKHRVERADWGVSDQGRPVGLWTLENASHRVHLAELGARWLGWRSAGRDLVLGLDSVTRVEVDTSYIGAVVGRYANRLRGGRFSVAGRDFRVPPNEGENCLHGGAGGLWAKVWQGSPGAIDGEPAVQFTVSSPDGEMGFPGNLRCRVTYVLTEVGVRIEYEAVSDADTVINLTNHAYFNLDGRSDVGHHELQVNAAQVVAIDDESLPTGGFWTVDGTDFDLRAPRRVGDVAGSTDPRVAAQRGLDHCYVLDGGREPVARLSADGVDLRVFTDQPGLQVYFGQWLTGGYRPLAGMCLETQGFPDAPNQPGFPSTELLAGRQWTSATRYELG